MSTATLGGYRAPTQGRARIALGDLPRSAFAALCLFLLAAISGVLTSEPAPYDLAMVLFAGTFFVLGLKLPRGLALPAVLLGMMLLGYMIGGLQAIYIDEALLTLRTSVFLVSGFLFLASMVAAAPGGAAPALWRGYLFAAAYSGALACGAFLNLLPNSEAFFGMGRAQALFPDPNIFGPFMVAPILYAAWRMTTARFGAILLFWAPLATIMVLGLFFSFSRGAWAHLIVSGGIFALLAYAAPQRRGQRKRIAVTTVVLVGLGMLAIAWALTIPEIRDVLDQRFGIQDYDTAEDGRFAGQLAALKMSLTHPFGIGQNNWALIRGVDTHNVYLNVLVSGGFISFVGFLGFMGVTLVKGLRYAMRGPRRGSFIVAYATLIGLLGEAVIIDINHWRHLYLLLAIIWGLMLARPPADVPERQRAGA